jgi:hypothetical protein
VQKKVLLEQINEMHELKDIYEHNLLQMRAGDSVGRAQDRENDYSVCLIALMWQVRNFTESEMRFQEQNSERHMRHRAEEIPRLQELRGAMNVDADATTEKLRKNHFDLDLYVPGVSMWKPVLTRDGDVAPMQRCPEEEAVRRKRLQSSGSLCASSSRSSARCALWSRSTAISALYRTSGASPALRWPRTPSPASSRRAEMLGRPWRSTSSSSDVRCPAAGVDVDRNRLRSLLPRVAHKRRISFFISERGGRPEEDADAGPVARHDHPGCWSGRARATRAALAWRRCWRRFGGSMRRRRPDAAPR